MSGTSSDTESSCGWTILSNEGSDIETLGPEAAAEDGLELSAGPTAAEPAPQHSNASLSAAADSPDDTLEEQTINETLHILAVGDGAAGKEHVYSSSDHSDIILLGDSKEQEEAAAKQELYLGTSCSSHYSFTATETAFQPSLRNSSSSEDEVVRSSSPLVRRRRVRKNTTSVTDQEEEQLHKPHPSDGEEREEQQQTEVIKTAGGRGNAVHRWLLLALLVAFSVAFGHLHGAGFIQKQKGFEREFPGLRDLLQQHVSDQGLVNQLVERSDSHQHHDDEQRVVSWLSGLIEKFKKENQELSTRLVQLQAQRDDLESMLKLAEDERTSFISQQQSLTEEKAALRRSLQQEEASLRSLRGRVRELELVGAAVDQLQSEKQRLTEQLESEQRRVRHHGLEAQALRGRLHREKKAAEELRRELGLLRGHVAEAGQEKAAALNAEDLRAHVVELQKRLSHEQQRSDLWERLYVETREEKAKGDRESRVRRARDSVAGRVKETFDAVKNSTKEFVHHQKEQIKKAKEAVKENLRKFSDSVKSTFSHFKDSASAFINKARGFYRKCDETNRESCRHKAHKHKSGPSRSSRSGQKSDGRTQKERPGSRRGCSGVSDCASQESMSLFNRASEPVRASEFHLLLQSFLQQQVEHFYHWAELEAFINSFFHNGVFIHDQMLFTDFVSAVEEYLGDLLEYQDPDDDVFRHLDDYIYRHFFGESYTKTSAPRGPFESPDRDSKQKRSPHQRKQNGERRWSTSGGAPDRHMADVKLELGPAPFGPKY